MMPDEQPTAAAKRTKAELVEIMERADACFQEIADNITDCNRVTVTIRMFLGGEQIRGDLVKTYMRREATRG